MWRKITLSFAIVIAACFIVAFIGHHQQKYTVISEYDYHAVTQQSEKDVKHLIHAIKPYQHHSDYVNRLVAKAFDYFKDRPYSHTGAEGEGDWCPGDIERHGCPHLQQDPIYRTDTFVCNTFVQVVLALLNTNSIQDYNKAILRIKYGAAGEPPSSVHYYNRNNFISADFNPINQKNGLIKDVTGTGVFAKYVKQTHAIIDRQSWFNQQMTPDKVGKTVRVLSAKDGALMAKRALNNYPAPYHKFSPINVAISYIPKEVLVRKIVLSDGKVSYQPNEKLINQIPTPSIVEIIRDAQKWKIAGKNIIEVIGSGINVSHLGFIYQADYKKGDIIYQRIHCEMKANKKICTVKPVICHRSRGCREVMFTHATDSYPSGYYYYRNSQGGYQCEANKPPAGTQFTQCNRVVSLPLKDYLTAMQYGKYTFMEEPSILGIHVEKILTRP
jgi:hypothetical protein